MDASSIEDRRLSRTRSGAGAGLVFVVLFLAGFIMTGRTPGADANAQAWADFYSDDAAQIMGFIGAYLLVLGGVSFLWFLSCLRGRVDTAHADERWAMAWACGVLYVAMVLVMAMVRTIVAINVLFADNDPRLGPEILRTLDILGGSLLLVAGGVAACALVFLVSRLGRQAGVFPSWLARAGYAAAILAAMSFLYLPALALYAWTALVSGYLLARPGGVAPAQG